MARLRRVSPSPSFHDSSVLDTYSRSTPELLPRTGRRGTAAALSPSPSVTSDKENHNVTPDTGFSKQDKGKGRMPPPARPMMEQRGSKRRRLGEQTPRSLSARPSPDKEEGDDDDETARDDAESHYTIPDQKWFNPEQDEDERRHVRHSMRENIREFNDHRDEMLADNGERIIKSVKKFNQLFKSVRQTSDATIDSGHMVRVSDLAVKKAKADGDTSAGVDIDDFVTRCIRFMRTGGPPRDESQDSRTTTARITQVRQDQQQRRRVRQAESDDEAEEEQGDGLPWHIFGANACLPCNKRPPVPCFLLGPLSVQKRARQATQRTQRRTQNAATQEVSRPQELRGEDLQTNDNTNLTILVTKIYKRLKEVQQHGEHAIEAALEDNDLSEEALKALCETVHIRRAAEDSQPGVPLFEFVINPGSFGQSVENCFYVSFLIKEGKAALLFDEDGLPILRCIQNVRSVEEQRAQNVHKRQAIIGLDYSYWEQLISAFDISEPLIPHREEDQQQVGRTGWYG